MSVVLIAAGCANTASVDSTQYGFVDFTTKPDGEPPMELDTGQSANFLQEATGRKPEIARGALIHGALPATDDGRNFANYYQARIGGDCRTYGASWTVDAGDMSRTAGVAVIAAWGHIYQASVNQVPKTPGHITIDTMTGAWKWWVGDGGPETGSSNLRSVKSGTFAPPPSDGKTVWKAAVHLDPEHGIGFLYLPGPDRSTGTRVVSLTDSEIATSLTAAKLPVKTISELVDGADVVMVEHFARGADAGSARYPNFSNMWAGCLPSAG